MGFPVPSTGSDTSSVIVVLNIWPRVAPAAPSGASGAAAGIRPPRSSPESIAAASCPPPSPRHCLSGPAPTTPGRRPPPRPGSAYAPDQSDCQSPLSCWTERTAPPAGSIRRNPCSYRPKRRLLRAAANRHLRRVSRLRSKSLAALPKLTALPFRLLETLLPSAAGSAPGHARPAGRTSAASPTQQQVSPAIDRFPAPCVSGSRPCSMAISGPSGLPVAFRSPPAQTRGSILSLDPKRLLELRVYGNRKVVEATCQRS